MSDLYKITHTTECRKFFQKTTNIFIKNINFKTKHYDQRLHKRVSTF